MRKILLLSLPLGLVACGRGADNINTDRENLAVTADTSSTYGDPNAAAPMTRVPDSGANMTVAGQLAEVNNSGVGGTLSLTAIPAGTRIMLSVSNVQAGSTLEIALEPGKCGTPSQGNNVVGTMPIDASGGGSTTVDAPIPATTVMNGQHSLVVKTPQAGPATPPLGCADIPSNTPGQPVS
jgi:hypothetical protein